jgi:hypothetical protein
VSKSCAMHTFNSSASEITLRPQAQHVALVAGRKREQTAQFRAEYAKGAGVEATIAQSVRTGQVRQARYLGQAKTHLQHLMTAAIMNVMRVLRWLAEEPKAKTPRSAFARLYQAATLTDCYLGFATNIKVRMSRKTCSWWGAWLSTAIQPLYIDKRASLISHQRECYYLLYEGIHNPSPDRESYARHRRGRRTVERIPEHRTRSGALRQAACLSDRRQAWPAALQTRGCCDIHRFNVGAAWGC